ncbi:hypothetical protein ACJRO7_025160 [Eucalyptus globulus]|uniref:HTH La-type RNA-binding domain-containing protein n=1 Tax=Eucalyptus globulus TaxID=34317 RepID=A0ABD3KBU5_EUCGL
MRFISKDPEGYVPISLVASFKKIKVLITSNAQLSSILQNSSKRIVSEDRRKVKRRYPLTDSDMEELQSRVVIAENLPEDHCTPEPYETFLSSWEPQASNGGTSLAPRSGKADGVHYTNKRSGLRVHLMHRHGVSVPLFLLYQKPSQAWGKKGHDGEEPWEEEDASISEQRLEKQLEDLMTVVAKQSPGPRMPDGTRGFTMGRGKPVSVSTT